jgi:phenylpyruvate tautomerase PptA (4-oxalocrotonate tautomerase family)
MDAQKALMQQIKLLNVDAKTKSQLAEMVTEVYAEAWEDGYATGGRFAQPDKAVL